MKTTQYPPSVQRALRKLGQDIQIARKKRRMTVEDFGDRLGVGKGTVIRLERGEAGISIGTLTMALLALGELHRMSDLIDVASDDSGLLLDRERLPERVRHPRSTPRSKDEPQDNGPGTEGMGF